jgi:hypothetical protein
MPGCDTPFALDQDLQVYLTWQSMLAGFLKASVLISHHQPASPRQCYSNSGGEATLDLGQHHMCDWILFDNPQCQLAIGPDRENMSCVSFRKLSTRSFLDIVSA